MRRPWQIWLTCGLILTLLASGFAWLTVRVIDLDARERLSRAQAKQEEQIRLALWRMESVAMPIVAAEAARPFVAYEPFYQSPGDAPGTPARRTPSPLLRLPSEYVLLNFQIDPDGTVQSPQCPPPREQQWAFSNGTTPALLTMCCPRVEELQTTLELKSLLSQLPREQLPPLEENSEQVGADPSDSFVPNSYVQNTNALRMQQAFDADETSSQKEFVSRSSKLQMLAQMEAKQQRTGPRGVEAADSAREGVSRPVWIGDRLLLARRVRVGAQEFVQGCWLNWEKLRAELEAELSDLLPDATLESVPASAAVLPGRTLASIPVQIIPSPVQVERYEGTPTQMALAAAWASLLVASLALALLIYGVTSLSERRAAFVSAVTHELRTPLTTLQLYTDMLRGEIVTEEQQRREYTQTLHRETSRLKHLVDNVLALSRLERRSSRRTPETVTAGELLARAQPRLAARAAQSQRPLEVQVDDSAADALVTVDSTVVEQILLNLVDNGCKHADKAADRRLVLHARASDSSVEVRVRDFGCGVSDNAKKKLFRRFSRSDLEAARTAPGLGLGLALSRDLARSEGGDLQLEETSPHGTTFVLRLRRTR